MAAVWTLGASLPATEESKAAGLRGNPGRFFGGDAYPVEAIRAGQQGRVVAKLWIDDTGKVMSWVVQSTSGSASLDETTCRIALDRVTFTPSTNEKSRAIAATYVLPVRRVLPQGPVDVATMPLDQTMAMTVSVDADARIVACDAVLTPLAPLAPTPCDAFPVGKPTTFRWTRNGKAVDGTVKRTLRQQIALDP